MSAIIEKTLPIARPIVSMADFLNLGTIFTFHSNPALLTLFLTLKLIFFPLSIAFSLAELILNTADAINSKQANSIFRAIVSGIAFTAVTIAIIGGLAAATAFKLISPVIFVGVFALNLSINLGYGAYHLVKTGVEKQLQDDYEKQEALLAHLSRQQQRLEQQLHQVLTNPGLPKTDANKIDQIRGEIRTLAGRRHDVKQHLLIQQPAYRAAKKKRSEYGEKMMDNIIISAIISIAIAGLVPTMIFSLPVVGVPFGFAAAVVGMGFATYKLMRHLETPASTLATPGVKDKEEAPNHTATPNHLTLSERVGDLPQPLSTRDILSAATAKQASPLLPETVPLLNHATASPVSIHSVTPSPIASVGANMRLFTHPKPQAKQKTPYRFNTDSRRLIYMGNKI